MNDLIKREREAWLAYIDASFNPLLSASSVRKAREEYEIAEHDLAISLNTTFN